MRILIAEDDLSTRTLLTKLLSPYGRCEVAVNGREAIECFRLALDEQEPYELVCLDIMMPENDGHQVLASIRAQEETRGIAGLEAVKVIMISALDDSKNVLGAFKQGCEAYLTKPINKDQLVDRLRNLGLVS